MYRMYKAEWDQESSHDDSSLNSSFWSDGEEEDKQRTDEEQRAAASEIQTQEDTSREDDGEYDESCSVTFSPAPSLMTSGYGTFRPEGQDGGDDQDEEEDNRSLGSFHMEAAPTELTVQSKDEESECVVLASHEDEKMRLVKPQESHDTGSEGVSKVRSHDELPLEQQEKEGGASSREGDGRKPSECEDPDESSSNKDIMFIDSKVDWTYEWEGNLRHKDFSSSVQEHLSDLTLSPSTHRNITIQSGNTLDSDMEGGALSAFDSFVTHSTRARSDSNLPSKPKSFIRPIMTQQTIKKTDPVARCVCDMLEGTSSTSSCGTHSSFLESMTTSNSAGK
ncbi:protein starmaker isoform X3 [Dunckerocampus dactyliophorus]|uniref:protein starmaker isoform X3 n=1 Tax=Dunckerocampus dactyliophorus TaxID=161453 RepID=UPI002406BDAF|nr:protein starmaker isoform X3 [Dunckerocampus dactyliophorus]